MVTIIPLKILVVEDELLIRWSISEVLSASGHVVVHVGSAHAALEALAAAEDRFDVVLLDIRLPDSRDFTLLRQIRRLAPATAVIVMTAYGTPELVEEGLSLGASVVLDKPFEIAGLEPMIWSAHSAAAGPPS